MERLEYLKKPKQVDDPELFGKHVAARLRTFSPRLYATTCLKIEQVLVDAQFPPNHEHSYAPCNIPPAPHNTSSAPSQYTSDNNYYNF